MIELPDDFVTGMMSNATSILTEFSPLVYTIVGVILGVVILELIIGAIRHKG
jgi:hypothetical protein